MNMLILILVFFQQGAVQQPVPREMVIENFSTREGLGESFPRSIVRDSSGFLWVSHGNGVSRFDGYKFKTFTEGINSSMKGKDIWQLRIDSKNELWAVSRYGQINRYDPIKDDFIFYSRPQDSLTTSTYYLFEEINPGIFLLQYLPERKSEGLEFSFFSVKEARIGTLTIPISRKDKEFLDAQRLEGDNTFRFYKKLPNGTEWVSISGFLFTRIKGENNFRLQKNDNIHIPGISFRDMLLKDDSVAYFATNKGLFKYNLKQNSFQLFAFNPSQKSEQNSMIHSIASTKFDSQSIWMGTWANSLLRFDTKTEQFEQIVDKRNRLVANVPIVYTDDQGILWVGSNTAGLFKLNPTTLQTRSLLINQKDNDQDLRLGITQIWAVNDSTMFLSSFENGFYLVGLNGEIKFSESRVEEDKYLPHKSVWAGWIDKEEKLWLSTSGGLTFKPDYSSNLTDYEYNALPKSTKAFSRSVIGNGKDRIWYGANNGIHEYNYNVEEWTWYRSGNNDSLYLPEEEAIVMLLDSKERLWAGHTSKGISILDFNTDSTNIIRLKPKGFTKKDLLKVYHINERSSGDFVISTDQGVFEVDEEATAMRKMALHPVVDKEKVNVTYFDSKDRIWFGTINGVYILDSEKNLIHLSEADGLLNREINHSAIKDHNGSLWFSSYNGVIQFQSDTMSFGSSPYNTKIVNFEVIGDEQPNNISKNITLSNTQNNFKISTSNFDLRDPGSQKWFFRLRGFSNEWIPATERNVVQFTNIKPGNYVVDTRVDSRYGYSLSNASVLKINIIPVFWQTNWFQILMVLLGIGIIGSVIFLRFQRIIKVREERNRIMRDLHDDLSSVLASINFNVQTLKPNQPISLKIHERLQQISLSAVQTMRDLMWAVDPKNDRWGKVTDVFQSYVSNTLGGERWKIHWNISGDGNTIVNPETRKQTLLIFKEIIANILKHSKASELTVILALNSHIQIEVSDNGVGFNPKTVQKGVGLNSIQNRVKNLGAVCQLETAEGKGTHWKIEISL